MQPVVRIGDLSQGHDDYPPTTLAEGNGNVYANNIQIGVIGNAWAEHTQLNDPWESHVEHCASGSSSVFISNIPVSRVGDRSW